MARSRSHFELFAEVELKPGFQNGPCILAYKDISME